MNRLRRIGLSALALALSACAAAPTPPPVAASEASAHNNLYATLFLRTAAEYDAVAASIYGGALAQLDAVLADKHVTAALEQAPGFEALPPAAILDVDETVLDNSAYQSMLVTTGESYNRESWDRWVAEATADPTPGALGFARAAAERGVTLLYVTNRRCIQRVPGGDPCPQRAETRANLLRAGFPEPDMSHVVLRSAEFDFDGDKGSRRAALAQRYRIVMLFGDDLGDFVSGLREPGITRAQRDERVARHAERWGRTWFALPNPSYGSWLEALGEEPASHLGAWSNPAAN